MSTEVKRKTFLDIISDIINIFGNDTAVILDDELIEGQKRANEIMKKSNGATNVTSTKKSLGRVIESEKEGIVERVEVNIENIKFPDKMIQTYQQVKDGQEK